MHTCCKRLFASSSRRNGRHCWCASARCECGLRSMPCDGEPEEGTLGTGRPEVAPWYFPGPLCRQVKPKPTTVTHTWLALNAHHTVYRIISTGVPKQNVVFDCTLGFRNHTAGIIDYLMAHLQPTLNKFWTNRHTYIHTNIHTYNVLRGPGWRLLGIAMPPPLPR